MTNAAHKVLNNTGNSTINAVIIILTRRVNNPSFFVWDKHDKQQMSMRIGIFGHEHAAQDENLLDARTNLYSLHQSQSPICHTALAAATY